MNTYIESSDDQDKAKIVFRDSTNVYRFGDGKTITATRNTDIPVVIGSKQFTLNTDAVPNDTPSLLSKKSIETANMTLDFKNDNAIIFGEPELLIVTKSGHYAISISPYNKILNNVTNGSHANVTMIATADRSKQETALKLQRQFSHPILEKLIKLLNCAGEPWNCDEELKQQIKDLSSNYKTCQIYKKPPPRPVVGLLLATTIQECVAMDLKFYKKIILLHLVDHITRLSSSTVIPSKDPKAIIKAIFKSWIQKYGSAEKTGNGGEFETKNFIDMCESINIRFMLTAAKLPFSNGLKELYNLILSEIRRSQDHNTGFKLALAWCVNAKNSLANIHSFSPFQLALGQNPNYL